MKLLSTYEEETALENTPDFIREDLDRIPDLEDELNELEKQVAEVDSITEERDILQITLKALYKKYKYVQTYCDENREILNLIK